MSNQQDCPQHPGVPGLYVCARCQTGVCVECCYTLADGSICCKPCYATPAPQAVAASPEPAIAEPVGAAAAVESPAKPRLSLRMAQPTRIETPAPVIQQVARPGMGCVQHPSVPSAHKCRICGAGSCRTCDFVFNGVHYCPVCASTSSTKLSSSRKGYLIAAYVMASWVTLCIIILLSGALKHFVKDASGAILVMLAVMVLVGLPAFIGTAMAMSAMRKGSNTVPIWIALIWNSLILGGIMLMICLVLLLA